MNVAQFQHAMARRRRLSAFADVEALVDPGVSAGVIASQLEPNEASGGWSFKKAVAVGVTVGLVTHYLIRLIDRLGR